MRPAHLPSDSDPFRTAAQHFKEFVGTPEYMPPEAINNKPADFRADLWSYGGTIFHLVTGQPPFKGGSEYLTFKRVLEQKRRCPVGMPEDARDLIDALLRLDPKERLGGGVEQSEKHAAIKRHVFFTGISWDQLHEQKVPTPTPQELEVPSKALVLVKLARQPLPARIEVPEFPPHKHKPGSDGAIAAEARFNAARADYEAAKAQRDAEVVRLVMAGNIAKHVADWDEDLRTRVAFHLDVGKQLDEEVRRPRSRCPPPPPPTHLSEPGPCGRSMLPSACRTRNPRSWTISTPFLTAATRKLTPPVEPWPVTCFALSIESRKPGQAAEHGVNRLLLQTSAGTGLMSCSSSGRSCRARGTHSTHVLSPAAPAPGQRMPG